MTLSIHGSMPHANGAIEISEKAAKRARMTFNPSGNERVNRIKTLAAALYTELDEIVAAAHEQGNATAGREAATAATHLQSAAMFGVSATTEEGFIDPINGEAPTEPAKPGKAKGGK